MKSLNLGLPSSKPKQRCSRWRSPLGMRWPGEHSGLTGATVALVVPTVGPAVFVMTPTCCDSPTASYTLGPANTSFSYSRKTDK